MDTMNTENKCQTSGFNYNTSTLL